MVHSIALWPTAAVLGAATYTDLRSRRIPNWLVLPFLGMGVLVSCWSHGWHGLGQSLSGAGLGLLLFGIFFMAGGMGAGDVKLCAAIGAWIGPSQLLIALVLTALVGGVMALGWAMWGGFLGEALLPHRRPGDGFEGRARRSGARESAAAQDAIRTGHRDRNPAVVSDALKGLEGRCPASNKPDTIFQRVQTPSTSVTGSQGA